MIFYHFTTRDALPSIMQEGLNRGEAPLSERRVVQAVNLTSNPNPQGHGLDMGGHIVTEEEAAIFAAKGFGITAGTVFADKLEARIKLVIPRADRNLKPWRTWSRRHCEPGYAESLEQAAGPANKAKTWWLYFGIISPDQFIQVDVLKPEAAPPLTA